VRSGRGGRSFDKLGMYVPRYSCSKQMELLHEEHEEDETAGGGNSTNDQR
jgi:ribosomal protein S16